MRSLRPVSLAAILAAAAIRFGLFFHEPPGRDQGLFLTLADGVLRGKVLYRDLWEHKPPGVVALYAAALAAFGRSYAAIHLLQALSAALTAVLIERLVRRETSSPSAALLSALLYVLYAAGLMFGAYWGTAQPEVFMDLPVIAAVTLLSRARDGGGRPGALGLGAGLAVGWCVLLKYSAAPLAGLVLIGLAAGRSVRGRRTLLLLLGFAAGCVLPALAAAAVTAAAGAWEDFFRATVVFNAEHRRVATDSVWADWPAKTLYAPLALLPVYLAAALGAVLSVRPGAGGQRADGARALAGAAAWLWILALAQVFWQGKFWAYHYHVVLLPSCLLAGVGLSRAVAWLERRTDSRRTAVAVVATALLAAALPYLQYLQQYDRHHAISAAWSGRVSLEQMESTYNWGEDYEFAQTRAVAAALARETSAEQRVFVWGFEPLVYFLSGREPASRFLYDYPLMPRFSGVHPLYARQLLADLRRDPPARFVVLSRDANDIEPEDSLTQIRRWEELRAFLEAHYVPAWQIGDFRVFARADREIERGAAGEARGESAK